MARIMGFDFGLKRIGIAVTDPLQIIASPLDTVAPDKIENFLKDYLFNEEVECFVIGEPKKLDDTEADIMPQVRAFAKRLNTLFPNIPIVWQDERFTSREARQIIVQSGIKKMKRRDKTLVDKVSASLILKDWMISMGKWLV
jgi:putative Holliday junction resolvase